MKRFRIFDDIWNDTASGVSDFLAKTGDGESVQIDVMSYGGDLFSGLAIAEMLMEARKRGIKSTVVIYGLAASAAAILALAADRVVMTEIGSMMLHGVYHYTWEGDIITEGEDIDHANARCMAIINRRNPAYTLDMLTAKDNWYTAQQAKDLGFVDEIRPLDDFAQDATLKNMFTGLLNMAVHAAKPKGGLKMNKIKNDLDEKKEVTEQIEEPEKSEDTENKEIHAEGEGEGDVDLKSLIVDGFSAILDKLEAIRRQGVETDWTAKVVEDATMADIDEKAIAYARERYAVKHAAIVTREQVESWPLESFLDRARLTRDGKITRAALLRFASVVWEH